MKLLKRVKLCNVTDESRIILREATRAICIRGHDILLLYTGRYDDYSLPGGGVDADESYENALIRELNEETGAVNVKNIKPFGIYEEFRPWNREDEFDVQHMISYCYTCSIDEKLGQTSYESYEIKNNMKPVWINIDKAIDHNEHNILNSLKKGISIERETFLLKRIKDTLIQS
ncbi:MAG: NUDIX hydrolase [Algibacter sp.]